MVINREFEPETCACVCVFVQCDGDSRDDENVFGGRLDDEEMLMKVVAVRDTRVQE